MVQTNAASTESIPRSPHIYARTYAAIPSDDDRNFAADAMVPVPLVRPPLPCPAPPPHCQSIARPDGGYDIPAAVFDSPAAPLGLRVRASGLSVPIQCAMAARGGICASGEGCIDASDFAAGRCTYTNNVACSTRHSAPIGCRRFETLLSPSSSGRGTNSAGPCLQLSPC